MSQASEAVEFLKLERADAWYEYLHATKNQPPDRYQEVEPWAWAKLKARLRAITTREKKLAA